MGQMMTKVSVREIIIYVTFPLYILKLQQLFCIFPTCGVTFLSCPTEPGTFVFPEEKIKLLIKG